MSQKFPYLAFDAVIAFQMEDYYIWDTSVIKVDNQYYMFSSRWPKALGFGYNWLFNSEIILSKSDVPEGPYHFEKVILPRRGNMYFDGMNTHNTCIKRHKDKFYLYYMGTTYDPKEVETKGIWDEELALKTWNNKRIGLAISDKIDGEYIRRDKPLLEPRIDNWDATVTTNPSVAILKDGRTYMIYKSRKNNIDSTLRLGIAYADRPDGEFTRLSSNPLLEFEDKDFHVEDPFFWFNEDKKKFCLLVKDDVKNGKYGLTGEWGAGFYAESIDAVNYDIEKEPKVYSRTIKWKDGHISTQGNLERVSLLFDENNVPTHIFFASGKASSPYDFKEATYIICMKLKKKD